MRLLKGLLALAITAIPATLAFAQDRPRIVAVNYPLQYLAERLVGDAADVDFPVPTDVDPSFWRPSIADISAIQSSDLILLNGAGFATWVDRVSLPRSKVVNTTAAIEDQFIITESITHSHGEGEEHSHEGLASYVWLDPSLALAQAEAIGDALSARGIVPQDDLDESLATLRAEFEALDTETVAALADLNDVQMIATHPRYQYFARRYGVEITSLEWEAGAAPTDAELAELESVIADSGAGILIWEATPPAEAFDQTAALGLQNVVFPTLAHPVGGATLPQVLSTAVTALSEVE